MTKFIQNLEEKTQSVLMEGLTDDAAELTGLDKDIIDDAVKGLSYANYLELGNAIDLGDAETATEILSTVADLVPGDEVDLDEDLGDADQKLLRYYATKHPGPYNDELDPNLKGDAARLDYFRKTFPAPYDYELDENANYLTLDDLREADNPSKPAAATPAQPAVTPPSAGSSIDALAAPADSATDVDNNDMQQGRKEVDDLDIGDEIEVADIDGEPAAGRVRNANGPGDTIVITGKGNEEHMIRKDSILSTPVVAIPETLDRLKEQFETSLNEDDGVSIRRIEDGGAGRRIWQMRFEVGPLETMSHQDRSWQVSEALKGIIKGNRKLQRELKNRMGSWTFEKMPTEKDPNGIIYIVMRNDNVEENALTEGPGYAGEIQDQDIGKVIEVGDMITLTNGDYGQVERILQNGKARVREWGAGNDRGPTFFNVPLDGENRLVQYPEGPHSPRRSVSEAERFTGKTKAAVDKQEKTGKCMDCGQKLPKHTKKCPIGRGLSKPLGIKEGYGEETYDEMVEYWKGSLSRSIVSKGLFTQLYDAANQNIDELNAAIADEAYSIADSYHGTGDGIGSSDQNHFVASVASSLGIDDVFGWRKPKEGNDIRDLEGLDKHLALAHGMSSDEEMERDKANRGSRFKNLGEDDSFNFFVDPDKRGGAEVRSSNGDNHDYYDDEKEAVAVAQKLNKKYGKNEQGEPVDEELAEMQRKAGIQINEVKSGRFNSKAIGNQVRIVGQDDYGNSEHDGKIGTIISAEREHTFSAMVPFKIVYGVRLEDGTRAYVRRANIRKVKNIKETASGGATGAGAIASSPAAMNGVQKRNPSIYGQQTKLRKKPQTKKRKTSEDAGDGLGRGKKE